MDRQKTELDSASWGGLLDDIQEALRIAESVLDEARRATGIRKYQEIPLLTLALSLVHLHGLSAILDIYLEKLSAGYEQ